MIFSMFRGSYRYRKIHCFGQFQSISKMPLPRTVQTIRKNPTEPRSPLKIHHIVRLECLQRTCAGLSLQNLATWYRPKNVLSICDGLWILLGGQMPRLSVACEMKHENRCGNQWQSEHPSNTVIIKLWDNRG